jgi:hypothetical protein
VTWVAGFWIVAESINVAWPRTLNSQWWLNWGLIIMSVALGIVGLIVSAWIFRGGVASATATGVAAGTHLDTNHDAAE